MFINKAANGKNNICNENIYKLRTEMGLSQRMLAEKLKEIGLALDKNAIQRIEAGKRFVTDIELKAFSELFNVSMEDLLK